MEDGEVESVTPRRRVDAVLARELAQAGIEPVDETLLVEVEHALELRPHEGALPRFGAIVSLADSPGVPADWGARIEFEDVTRLRQLADGCASFVERTADGWQLVVCDHAVAEPTLARLCADYGVRVVRLLEDGALEVMAGEHLWVRRRARWWRRLTAAAFSRRLEESRHISIESEEVLGGLLDLAVHTLSPRRIGASLVLLPDWDRTGCDGDLARGGSTPLLRVTDRRLDAPIANLLMQHDGAALVSPDGLLWWTGAELAAPTHLDDPSREGGMRHRSAARFSELRPGAVVVVVSQDGPVSVFVGGVDLTPESP